MPVHGRNLTLKLLSLATKGLSAKKPNKASHAARPDGAQSPSTNVCMCFKRVTDKIKKHKERTE